MKQSIEDTIRNFVWWATFALSQERGERIETSFERAQSARSEVRAFR